MLSHNEAVRKAEHMSDKRIRFRTTLVAVLALGAFLAPALLTTIACAQTEQDPAKAVNSASLQWGVLAAALSVGLGCIGAAIAVAYVGAAAVAVVAEKPQLAGRTLIFVGLAEGIAIYGLIIAIMILAKV